MKKHEGYSSGHPWYYTLGGRILYPKDILEEVKEAGYRGYLSGAIDTAAHKQEPKRTVALRKLRTKALADLWDDLSVYRGCAVKLRRQRRAEQASGAQPAFDAVHQDMCLKHNHIYNNLAHLIALHELLSQQLDLFD